MMNIIFCRFSYELSTFSKLRIFLKHIIENIELLLADSLDSLTAPTSLKRKLEAVNLRVYVISISLRYRSLWHFCLQPSKRGCEPSAFDSKKDSATKPLLTQKATLQNYQLVLKLVDCSTR